jgi:Fe-S oxidoreductase
VLNNISKLKLKEAYFNKKDTRCCGLGGVLGITAPEISLKIAKSRSSELKEVCGSTVTACPACEMALKADKVLDISEVVLRGMKDGKGG